MWFEQLTGFREISPAHVRQNLLLDGDKLVSQRNGREMRFGRLETPSLGELRERVRRLQFPSGEMQLSEVVANVQELHLLPENENAVFQVASQFNLLEMASPAAIPEDGVDIYERDLTQGPACSIACGAGTIFRNYFVELPTQIGQTKDQQIDCLHDLGVELGNAEGRLWRMQNGYAMATEKGLIAIKDLLSTLDDSGYARLRDLLRIGCQWNTEVTLSERRDLVTQVYCSALPVRYTRHAPELWQEFATLVLEATYEATFCVALTNLIETGCNKLFLTMVGGGVFGNHPDWILHAIDRSVSLYANVPLDVQLVSFGRSNPTIRRFVEKSK